MSSLVTKRMCRTVKYEAMHLKAHDNGTIARRELRSYFRFYNNKRSYQALGYGSPRGAIPRRPDGDGEGIEGADVLYTTHVGITCSSDGTLT